MAKGKSDWAIREKKADILFRLKTRLRNGQVGLFYLVSFSKPVNFRILNGSVDLQLVDLNF